jgi:hypothetical protein
MWSLAVVQTGQNLKGRPVSPLNFTDLLPWRRPKLLPHTSSGLRRFLAKRKGECSNAIVLAFFKKNDKVRVANAFTKMSCHRFREQFKFARG